MICARWTSTERFLGPKSLQLIGRDLVGLAGNDLVEHLALAAGASAAPGVAARPSVHPRGREPDPRPQGHRLTLARICSAENGFSRKSAAPARSARTASGIVAVTGDDDHLQVYPAPDDFLLQAPCRPSRACGCRSPGKSRTAARRPEARSRNCSCAPHARRPPARHAATRAPRRRRPRSGMACCVLMTRTPRWNPARSG